jgi:hypothetical protein
VHEERTYHLRPTTMPIFLRHWAEQAMTGWFRRGISVVAAWAEMDQDQFVAILESRDEIGNDAAIGKAAAFVDGDVSGMIERVERRAVQWSLPQSYGLAPKIPEETFGRAEPARWETIDVGADGRTLYVKYHHGVHEELHHLEVLPLTDRIVVTVYLGTKLEYLGGGLVPAMAIVAWAIALLDEDVGGRRFYDGAASAQVERS